MSTVLRNHMACIDDKAPQEGAIAVGVLATADDPSQKESACTPPANNRRG